MAAQHRAQRPDEGAPVLSGIRADARVVLRRPLHLRGTGAIVRRATPGGWEVEFRTPAGTPMILVVPESAFRPA